jgi:hypothetical protein
MLFLLCMDDIYIYSDNSPSLDRTDTDIQWTSTQLVMELTTDNKYINISCHIWCTSSIHHIVQLVTNYLTSIGSKCLVQSAQNPAFRLNPESVWLNLCYQISLLTVHLNGLLQSQSSKNSISKRLPAPVPLNMLQISHGLPQNWTWASAVFSLLAIHHPTNSPNIPVINDNPIR